MIDEDAIRQRWDAVGSKLDERGRRLFAAGEVRTAGWGGLAVVSKITGLARSTINRGADDLDAEPPGFVSVGITSDTAEFAVQSIRCWLERMGRRRYPNARELTITADCGGSNGARVRLWKIELQKLADETKLVIHVCHYPPGTSKWNKIEHRLFCHITQNWRSRPLIDRLAVVELIGATTTKTGLKVESALDTPAIRRASRSAKPK